MKLATYTEKYAKLAIPFDDQTLNVAYWPNRINLEDILDPETQGALQLATGLVKVLKEWDLEDEAGPVPLTVDAMKGLPVNLLVEVQKAINTDLRPGEVTGSN